MSRKNKGRKIVSRLLFASPDEARAWIRRDGRPPRKSRASKVSANSPGDLVSGPNLIGKNAPQELDAGESVPSPNPYSSVSPDALIKLLSKIERYRPHSHPYEAPASVALQGMSGLLRYADRIIAYLNSQTGITRGEYDYVRALAEILDRDNSLHGPALREVVAHCHVPGVKHGKYLNTTGGASRSAGPEPGALDGVQHLSWRVLPPGEWAFSEIQAHFEGLRREHRDLPWDLGRLDFARKLKPIETWIGEDEFDGYVIFVFSGTSAALLDHPLKGNACYILRRNWRDLCRFSKVELLTRYPKAVERVVHRGNWGKRIRRALKLPPTQKRRTEKTSRPSTKDGGAGATRKKGKTAKRSKRKKHPARR